MTNIQIKDISIDKGTYTATDTSINWDIGELESEEEVTLTITAEFSYTGSISNMAILNDLQRAIANVKVVGPPV